ncbi:hypothetical protein [Kitasatospora sp. GAS1066B]|uniref:hypothetical protein n=1 Tax=Kitasatospora sp. GAS1066B TaxID=3156271 RepID=UPI003517CCAB
MTTITSNDRLRAEVAAIEQSLVTGAWVPGRCELRLGTRFLTLSTQLDKDRPSHLPRARHEFDGGRTHSLRFQGRLTEASEKLLSALWVRLLLRRSPMRRLVSVYVEAGQDLLPHARRLIAAWRVDPPVLDREHLDHFIERTGLTDAEAEERVWRSTVEAWEEEQLPRAEAEKLVPASQVMSLAATVVVAAVTGDIEY